MIRIPIIFIIIMIIIILMMRPKNTHLLRLVGPEVLQSCRVHQRGVHARLNLIAMMMRMMMMRMMMMMITTMMMILMMIMMTRMMRMMMKTKTTMMVTVTYLQANPQCVVVFVGLHTADNVIK